MKKRLVMLAFMLFAGIAGAACPWVDISGDCKVNLEDFAIMASEWQSDEGGWGDLNGDGMVDLFDLALMASEWLEEGFPEITWVSINDPGVDDNDDGMPDHEPFNGEMSKYETTNTQYCKFLNDALASGDVVVDGDYVKGADGSNSGADFVGEAYLDTNAALYSQITYSGGVFSVRSRDGYDMSNHPVVRVNWYGATAFCNYYGYRLPTEWEWQAVADYDGSFTYGCGLTMDQSKANYDYNNPLNLSSYPETSPVDYFPSYGYGMNDMAGNVWEWTDSRWSGGSYRVMRGGSWLRRDVYCTVSYRSNYNPIWTFMSIGFRVCR